MLKYMAALVFVVLMAAPASAKWYLYETRNFAVYTELGPDFSKEYAHNLEHYRANLIYALQLDIRHPDQLPLSVYIAKSERNYQKITGPGRKNTAGLFLNAENRPIAVLYKQRKRSRYSMKSMQVLLHEYIHYVMRQSVPVYYPTWYSEGMAEFMSAHDINDGLIRFGEFLPARIPSLSQDHEWFPLKQLMRINSTAGLEKKRRKASIFYAQSWFLTHMFLVHDRFSSEAPFFLRDLSKGSTPEEALLKHYNMSFDELEVFFRSYFDRLTKLKQLVLPYRKAKIELIGERYLNAREADLLEYDLKLLFIHGKDNQEKLLKKLKSQYNKTQDTKYADLYVQSMLQQSLTLEANEFVDLEIGKYPSKLELKVSKARILIERMKKKLAIKGSSHLSEMIQDLKTYAEANPWNAEVRHLIAVAILLEANDPTQFDDAAFYINDAYALYPQYYPITLLYVDLLLHQKQYHAACQLLKPLYHMRESSGQRKHIAEKVKQIPRHLETCPM